MGCDAKIKLQMRKKRTNGGIRKVLLWTVVVEGEKNDEEEDWNVSLLLLIFESRTMVEYTLTVIQTGKLGNEPGFTLVKILDLTMCEKWESCVYSPQIQLLNDWLWEGKKRWESSKSWESKDCDCDLLQATTFSLSLFPAPSTQPAALSMGTNFTSFPLLPSSSKNHVLPFVYPALLFTFPSLTLLLFP